MDLAAMRTRCAAVFSDETFIVVTSAQWDEDLNVGYRQFLAATDWPNALTVTDLAFAAAVKFVVPGSKEILGSVRAVRDATNGTVLRQMPDMPERERIFLEGRNTKPLYYEVAGEASVILPSAKVGATIRVTHQTEPAALVAGGDIPAIPDRYHDALVYKALELRHREDGDGESADRFAALFERLVADASEDVEATRREQMAEVGSE